MPLKLMHALNMSAVPANITGNRFLKLLQHCHYSALQIFNTV
jgi:hypothetical protein